MVNRGLRVLGVLVFVVPLSCGPDDEPSADNAGGASGGKGGSGGTSGGGGKGGGGGGGGGSSGSGASSGAVGKGGRGGAAGAASGGRGGGVATGGSNSGGSSGRGGADPVGGNGGGGTSGDAGDTGSSGDTGEGGAKGDSLSWSDDGVISADTNDFGIKGTWFIETDCDDATTAGLPCTVMDNSLIGPDAQAGWTTTADSVCAKGVATQVINDPMNGMPAYSLQWGFQLGFELNGTSAGTPQAYDAVMHGLRGFVFDITTNNFAPPTLRVNIATAGTAATFSEHFVELSLPALQQVILLDDALQGSWVINQIPLDKRALTVVTFHVYTNVTASKPFDFCISNARVIH